MSLLRELILAGISHRTAPVEVRELCVVAPADLRARLGALREGGGFPECLILSTCNRTEILALAEDVPLGSGHLEEAVFGQAGPIPPNALYAHHGVEAVFHLFRVAAGLESQVLGESQILSQIKEAAQAARDAGTLGPVLSSLLDHALSLGKRVRTQTRLGEGTLSVARAAVELAQKVLGDLATVRALVLGAGETGVLVARHLSEAGCRRFVFANRTLSRAEDLAREFGGEARSLDDLGLVLPDMNLSVVSVDASEPIVRPAHLDPVRLRRHDRPPVLIDISMPRGVDPALKNHPDLLVHDLDDLDAIVARHLRERKAEIEAAGRIVVEETHKWFVLRTYAAFKPAITGLMDRFEEIRRDLLAEAGLDGGDAESFSIKLTRRLLDEALGTLKEGARKSVSEEHLDRRYRSWLERT
jgi:glutamyl-tRNA reductase